MQKKIGKMVFCFWDKCIWRCFNKFSLLRSDYLSSAVNVLTKSNKILHNTKRDFFKLNCLHSDQAIWWSCCREEFNSVSVYLSFCFSEGPLKEDFLDIYLTTFFRVRKFKTTSAMKVILFLKMLKIEVRFPECQKKLGKCFFVAEIIASEDVAVNCLY